MSGCGNENPDDDVRAAIKASMDEISDEEPKVKASKPECFADMNLLRSWIRAVTSIACIKINAINF
jgi:hypothetical protein